MKLTQRKAGFPAMRPELERMFDRFFQTPLWPVATPRLEALWEPALDVSETAGEYLVRLEAPGITRDDLDVNLDGNLLTLSGRRELHREEKGEEFLWEEREEGRFMRTLRLPGAVQEAGIEATYSDGVLQVRLPKAEPSARSRITVK
jgi:HSP20 family protein